MRPGAAPGPNDRLAGGPALISTCVLGEFEPRRVEGYVLVELKALCKLTEAHCAQVINYLKAYRLGVALLINFGEASLNFRCFLHNPSH
ncbi:GxxExxY protein [Hymenobacter rubripertinctus]|uniref:GxxExxY protein n=1 Tax=Hymenobacter rubripertinctus TaxID=2029981 RepID=UPI001FEA0222|nr:GxxExxY protein [Hymenobacter rubripertinctus]